MRRIFWSLALTPLIVSPALAQKAQIEQANARWMQLFNRGDFGGIAMIYTPNAQAFPPDAPDRADVEGHGRAGYGPEGRDARGETTRPKSAREIGTFSLKTKGAEPKEFLANTSSPKGEGLLDDCNKHLECWQIVEAIG
jgi:hypothetical protein